MSYRLRISTRAAQELRKLPQEIIVRIDRQITALAENPGPPGCRKLKCRKPEGWRIRVGNYRILCHVDEPSREVTVYRVGHRRGIYN